MILCLDMISRHSLRDPLVLVSRMRKHQVRLARRNKGLLLKGLAARKEKVVYHLKNGAKAIQVQAETSTNLQHEVHQVDEEIDIKAPG